MEEIERLLKKIQTSHRQFWDSNTGKYLSGTKFLIKQKLRFLYLEYFHLYISIVHIYGPKRIDYGENELIVISLFRNEELRINSFIQHYQCLGVKHIILLDNNSTDQSLKFVRKYSNISVFSTKTPFRKNNIAIRRFMINRHTKNRWVLCVDMDELFDFPFSHKISLTQFLFYLNFFGYTGVVTHMLDMFSDLPIDKVQCSNTDNIKNKFPYYDISGISSVNFYEIRYQETWRLLSQKSIIPDNIRFYKGGIRSILFGMHDVYLTKQSLMFNGNGVKPVVHQHFVDNANIADITCVLFHYKFLSDFPDKVNKAVSEKNYANNSFEYKVYKKFLLQNPNLTFIQPSSKRLESLDDLIEENFILVSDAYKKYIKSELI